MTKIFAILILAFLLFVLACSKASVKSEYVEVHRDDKAIELDSNCTPDVYLAMAGTYLIKKDYDKAIEYYQKAIELDSKDAELYGSMGIVYVEKGDYDKAIEYFQKSIELNHDHFAGVYHEVAIAYTKIKNYDKAAVYFKAIGINPENQERDRDDIMAVVKARLPDLTNIYDNYLKLKPGFSGKVILKFTILPTGEIAKITLLESTTGYQEFDDEIKNAVFTWKWNVVNGGNTTPTIPFNFSE